MEINVADSSTQPSKKNVYYFLSIENESIADLTTSFGTVSIFSMAVFFVWHANRIRVQDYNCFPNYFGLIFLVVNPFV